MSRCPRCKEYTFNPDHECPPVWYVEVLNAEDAPADEDERETRTVYAHGASDAAEKAVEAWDDGELAHNGDDIDAVVYDAGMAMVGRFVVGAYVKPVYFAAERQPVAA